MPGWRSVYEGDEIAGNLRERLDEAIKGQACEILRVKNNRVLELAMRGWTRRKHLTTWT